MGCQADACRRTPSGCRHAAPAAACRSPRATERGVRASGLSGERQGVDTHAVDPRRTLVAPDLRQRLPQIVAVDNRFHHGPARAAGLSGRVRRQASAPAQRGCGLHPLPPQERPAQAGFSAAWPMRELRPTRPSNRSGLRRRTPPTMPSADFSTAISAPHGGLSPEFRTRRRPPEVSSTAFPAHPPDLPPRPLMTLDFAVICLLVRPGRPRIRFLSIRSRVCSTLPSDPASRRRPCASLTLRRHQAG